MTAFWLGVLAGCVAAAAVFGILARYMASRVGHKGIATLEGLAEEVMANHDTPASLMAALLGGSQDAFGQADKHVADDDPEHERPVAEPHVPIFSRSTILDGYVCQDIDDSRHTLPVSDWPIFQKVATTRAIRMVSPFIVETSEGRLRCEDGYLAIDARGYPYPIAIDEFEQIYERAI